MTERRYINPATVKSIRARLGLSQTEVAEAAGIDRTALHRIETGKRNPRQATIASLAGALGVDVECITERAA